MAKALKKPQPMSSVDRFFSGASLEDALAPHAIEKNAAPEEESGRARTPIETAATVAATPLITEDEVAARPVEREERPRTDATARVERIAEAIEPKTARPTIAIVAPRPEAPVMRTAEPVDRQREFQLTRSADETLEDLILVYKRATGAEVTRSHVLRAVLKAVSERMPSLKAAASGIGPLRRPSNARGFEEAREEFEDQIKAAFLEGIGMR